LSNSVHYNIMCDRYMDQRWSGRRFTYDVDTDKWDESPVVLRLAEEPFAEGGMRLAYRSREVLGDGDEVECVAKTFKPGTESIAQLTFDEVMTQMVAERHAQDFNKACAASGLPHRLAFLPTSVVQLDERHDPISVEPFLAGQYVNHNDNDGHNETDNELAAAFSYFTYCNSGKLLVICDIQGVGDFYTDPQAHTFDGEGFGAGNLGADGISRFLSNHRHSLLCEQLGLPSLDAELTDEELARKLQAQEDAEAEEAEAEEAALGGQSGFRDTELGQRYSSSVDELRMMLERLR